MAPTPSKKLSRLHKPPDMTLEAWQRELRRQFGREQAFTLTNVGADAVFSQFDVHNPRTGGVYRVAIRGTAPGVNYCGCPDFATNSLGTCKHVEFVLERLQRRPRSRAVLRQGFRPLNLQHASVVVNMDLPWNPAVLEQRIGRVHRLGQRQPVRVVNFVAEGTIEEGMLTTLAFKKSLFAGVLDGGEREVFLGGSRLTRFMESVEQTTAAIGPPQAADDDVTAVAGPAPSGLETPGPDASASGSAAVTSPSPAPPPAEMDRAWAAVLQAGVALLEQVAAASKASSDGGQGLRIVQRDPTTGEDYLRIPLPPPELLERLLHTVLALTGRDRR